MEHDHDAPARHVLKLRRPARVKGAVLEELKLREPTLGEVWTAEGEIQTRSDPEARTVYLRKLVSQVTGVRDEDVLDEVVMADLVAGYKYLLRFIDASLEPVENPDETLEIQLPTPLEDDGVSYHALSLQAPTTGAVRKAQGHLRKGIGPQSLRSQQMWLISYVTGLPFAVVKQIPVSIGNAAQAYLASF